MAGTLYVVATPLGNLGDLTARAVATLRDITVVAAEDTRRARTLLAYIGATPRLVSYHAHSRPAVGAKLITLLADGIDVALLTDAGTPGVSDPGTGLAAAARARGIRVTPIPGPSAVAAALSAAGFPADRYLFLGFLPRGGRRRAELLGEAGRSSWTVVLFEAAPRLAPLLRDLARVAGEERRVVVAREITKLHEEFRDGTAMQLAGYYAETPARGEVTVVLAGRGPGASPAAAGVAEQEAARARARELLATGRSRRDVTQALAEEFGWTRNAAYRFVAGL